MIKSILLVECDNMAKFLICYYSDYGETMYDTLFGILRDHGNDVFRFNINCSAIAINYWGGKTKVIDDRCIDEIKVFNPDVVLNFNNSLPIEVYEVLQGCAKVCIIDADNPDTFWNKDYLLDHKDELFYLGLQSYSKQMYESYLGSELKDNYLYFPPGTAVKNQKIEQDKNISFIGSNFYPLDIPPGEDFYSQMGLDLYDALKQNYYLTIDEAKSICPHCSNVPWLLEKVRAYYVGQDRLKHMQLLVDLGFTFYGVRWWNHIAYYDFELAKCFDPTPKITLSDNQEVYNSSKISVNISHPQAKSSFSWRVMDIMASNSCLLMEDKKDWRNLFEQYLSKETVNAIIYSDMYDMRNKAINLLNDDDLRKRCVADLNNAIDQNGRWHHRLINLEKFLNTPIVYLENNSPILKSYGLDADEAIVNDRLFKKRRFNFWR